MTEAKSNTIIENPEPTSSKGSRTRERILDAATKLFAMHGYIGASIRDIEQEAGVNRGLVTYHFGNKDELWKAMFAHTFIRHLDDFRSKADILRSVDVRSRMRLIIEIFIRTAAAKPYLNQLMIQENYENSWRTEWIIQHYHLPLRKLNATFGEDNAVVARIESDPHLRYALLGACSMPFSVSCEVDSLFNLDVMDDQFIQGHIDAVLSLFEGFLDKPH